jgi:L-ascorbate metabolism protein UlaG (beta-lactamase superfamily)
MQILWRGGSTVSLSTKKKKAILNPSPKTDVAEYQIVAFDRTEGDHPRGEGFITIDWPGEYDASGFLIKGVESHEKKGGKIAYVFSSPSGNVAWMGELSEYPSEHFIEELGEVHVLIVPVGGKDVLNAESAYKLVEAVEPLYVIPICYGEKREGLSLFLKEMDVKMPQAQKSFEPKKTDMSEEKMELVILEPQ